MKQKIPTEDFISLIYALAAEFGVNTISIGEISNLIYIMNTVPAFGTILDSLENKEISTDEIIKNKHTSKFSKDDVITFDVPEKTAHDIAEKYSTIASTLKKAMSVHYTARNINYETDGIAFLSLDNPDTMYELTSSSSNNPKIESMLFTDGDVEIDRSYIDNSTGDLFFSRDVRVTNSTFGIVAVMHDFEPCQIVVRSMFIKRSHLLGEISKIRRNIINDYRLVDDESPKIYKLIRQ